MREPFVGRHRELAHLRSAVDNALRGGACIATVSGAAGIGKTRIVEELAAYAGVRGYQVFWGRCHEADAIPAYWPWAQILRSALRGRDLTWMREHAIEIAPYFGHAVPELRRLASETASPAFSGQESSRFYLFAALSSFISSLSLRQPLMVILDDLHWADVSSLLALEYLAIELDSEPIVVVGTYREPLMEHQRQLLHAVGTLPRVRGFMHLGLDRLDEDDVRHYLRAALGFEPPAHVVRSVTSRCEGNPFVMTELARLLQRSDIWLVEAPADDTTRLDRVLPDGVEASIRSRRALLSDSCNRIIDVAAVIGREFDSALLEELFPDQGREHVRAALDEASTAWLTGELPGVAGRHQFTHVLVQDSVYRSIPPERRNDLHAAVGQALERRFGADADSHAAMIAHHLERAGNGAGTDKAARYLLVAGEQALNVYAYEEAESCFRRALRLISAADAPADTARALFGVGRAEGALGRVLDAWQSIGQAFRLFVQTGDRAGAVEAAKYPLFYVPSVPDPTALVSEALLLVPEASRDAGHLLCRYGLLVNLERADYRAANEALDAAISVARIEGDTLLEMQALTNAADIAWYHLRHDEAYSHSTRAIDLARMSGVAHAEAWPRFLAASTAWFTGDMARLAHHSLVMLETAQRVRNHGFLGHAFLLRAMVDYAGGDLTGARDWLQQGRQIAPDFFWLVTLQAILDHEAGETERADAGVEHLLDLMRRTPPGASGEYVAPAIVIPLAARLAGRSLSSDVVESCARTVLSAPAVSPRVAADVRTGLALLAMQQKEADRSALLLEQLAPAAGTLSPMLVSIDRVLALLAATAGNAQRAQSYFEESLNLCRTTGYLPEMAWVSADYAEWLLGNHELRDPRRAASLLDDAVRIAENRGMMALAARAERLRSDVTPAVVADTPDGLTPREIEVLRLLAGGCSNKDIADRLFISVHTVGHHVSSILAKTGVASRSGAAAYATRNDLA